MSKQRAERAEVREILFAARDNEATDKQLSRLDHLIRTRPELREYAVKYVHLFSSLHWNAAALRGTPVDAPPPESQPAPQTAPLPTPASESKRGMLARPRLVSMVVSAASLALVLLILALIAPPVYRGFQSQAAVAQVTRTVGAHWGADSTVHRAGDALRVGDQVQLNGGLIELEFADGARMRLRGPCAVSLAGPRHGDLQYGHVMVFASSGFEVSAPRAHVTDLGTVFAVQAAQNTGETEIDVFEGAVDAELTDRNGTVLKRVRLGAGEAVAWNAAQTKPRPAEAAARLADLSTWRPLPVVNTGKGLGVGEIDAHWEIAAATSAGAARPGPARVTAPAPTYLRADAKSNWLGPGTVSGKAVVTFRTRFTLSGIDPATARITGQFSADNVLQSIRLNGHEIPVPAHRPEDFNRFRPFAIDNGFVAGENSLEFTVSNLATIDSLLSLRVELAGEGQAVNK